MRSWVPVRSRPARTRRRLRRWRARAGRSKRSGSPDRRRGHLARRPHGIHNSLPGADGGVASCAERQSSRGMHPRGVKRPSRPGCGRPAIVRAGPRRTRVRRLCPAIATRSACGCRDAAGVAAQNLRGESPVPGECGRPFTPSEKIVRDLASNPRVCWVGDRGSTAGQRECGGWSRMAGRGPCRGRAAREAWPEPPRVWREAPPPE